MSSQYGTAITPHSAAAALHPYVRGSYVPPPTPPDDPLEVAENAKARYFYVPAEQSDLEAAVQSGVWAAQEGNEKVLTEAFKEGVPVFIVFGVGKSEIFGYARCVWGSLYGALWVVYGGLYWFMGGLWSCVCVLWCVFVVIKKGFLCTIKVVFGHYMRFLSTFMLILSCFLPSFPLP